MSVRFRRLAINGKFLSAGPTGVHRVAEQLVRQLATRRDEIADLFEQPPRLIAPLNAHSKSLDVFDREHGGVFRGQLWEQIDLPRLTRSDLLLNLCNLGPMASRAAITMIHYAQTFITPESYSWAFANWYRNVLPVLGHRHARILAASNFSANELARFGFARRHSTWGVPHKAVWASELGQLKLVLVGAAKREEFERVGHSVPSNVVFAGRISDGELRALLESALCVGFPSTTEGFGLPPLEGMRLGCPALLAPCGALPEVGGDSALFAGPGDPRQWVAAIRRLGDDADFWASYSHAGRQRAGSFTWRRAGQKLVDVVKEVVLADVSRGR